MSDVQPETGGGAGDLTRRKMIARGLGITAGVAVGSWVRPAVASINLAQTAPGSPENPGGQPSIEVTKTVDTGSVTRVISQTDLLKDEMTVSGTITIANVSDSIVPVYIKSIRDVVEFRYGTQWAEAQTTPVSIPCVGSQIPAVFMATCTGPYTVKALVPIDSTTFRNVVYVSIWFREDQEFHYRQSFDTTQEFVKASPRKK